MRIKLTRACQNCWTMRKILMIRGDPRRCALRKPVTMLNDKARHKWGALGAVRIYTARDTGDVAHKTGWF